MKKKAERTPRSANAARGVEKVEMYNLCRREAGDVGYSVVGRPRKVAAEGVVPLATDREGVISDDGEYISVVDIEKSSIRRVERLGSVAWCAVPGDRGTIVMCADGAHYCPRDTDGQIHDSGGVPEWGAVSIVAEPAETINYVTDSVTLGREYTVGTMTESSDRALLQREVERAYERLVADAHRLGLFIAPVIARPTLRDTCGAVLWRGPELLIMPPGEYFFGRTIELEMQDSLTVGASVRAVQGYRLHVRVSAGGVQAWNERAARLEIEVSPQFHPWTKNAVYHGQVTTVRQSSGGIAVLVPLPAAEMGLSPSYPERTAHLVRVVTAAFDRIASTTAVIERPYERGADTSVGCRGLKNLEAEATVMERVISAARHVATPDEVRLRRITAPHSFTARSVAVGSGAVLWGNITIDRYRGYSAMDMAGRVIAGRGWTSCTKVTFDDGTSAVRIDRGTDNAPEMLNSLITYPDAGARRIDVTVEYDEEGAAPRRWAINLEAASDGLRAISIDTSLEGRKGTDDKEGWITETGDRRAVPVEMTGAVVVAHADRPLETTAILGGEEAVRAVVSARIAGGAWNYGRTRFYVFRDNVVELVTTERDTKALASIRIADVGVRSGDAVTTGSDGAVYFVSGRSLYVISGTVGTIKMLSLLDTPADRAGYDSERGEVMVCDSSGVGCVYHVDSVTGEVNIRTTTAGPSNEWVVSGRHVLAATQDGLYDMAIRARDVEPTTEVTFRATVTGPMALRAVTWRVDSTNFTGDMRVDRDYMGKRRAEVSRVRVVGAVHTPICLPLPVRPMGRAVLTMTAMVSADTKVDLPTVYC